MPATPQGVNAASSDTAKILEAIQGMKTQVNGMETRLTKLEMPAAKPKGAQNRTVSSARGTRRRTSTSSHRCRSSRRTRFAREACAMAKSGGLRMAM